MRVLHVGKFYPPHPGGIERATADICVALRQRGVDMAVLAHAAPGVRQHGESRIDDVEVTLAACHGQLLYAPVSPAFPRLLARRIAQFRPELLHLHMPNPSALSVLMLPAARRLPWIVHWHADIPLDTAQARLRFAYKLYRPWEQALLAHAQAIVATSPTYLDASAALSAWRDKARVIPLGIAATTATPAEAPPWPAGKLRVLAVGRLSHYKGFDVLLRALANVPEATLLLVGKGECETELRALARQLGIEARVNFAGFIADDALAATYAQADVLCLPSLERSEAFGVVLLEAMRAGVPVVASDIRGSGVGYVVRDGASGLLVPPGDVDVLSAALQRLRDDNALRETLGAAGRQRWSEEFTLERAAQRMLTLYRDVLQANRDKARPAA